MEQHLLGGQCVVGDGPEWARPSPIDGAPLPASRLITAAMADKAVSFANTAVPAASELSIADRAAALRQLADALDREKDTLATAITLENGCPTDQAIALQVLSAVGLLRAYADLCEQHVFSETRAGLRGGTVVIQKHPVGVAVGIVPWNVPIFLACMKFGPAIAAGCPIILKPSPENVASMGLFARLLARIELPEGLIQLVTGDRHLGEALVSHSAVSKVSFTGSTAAGRAVGAACAEHFTRCTLELGGKSAAILLDDFDLEAVRDPFFLATLQNNGQVCGAQSRVLVPRTKLNFYTDQIGDMFRTLNTGDPRLSGIDVGPVATPAQRDKIKAMIEQAVRDGVRTVATSDPPDAGEGTAYIPPTLLCTDDPSLDIAREEVFGPVTVIIPYDSEEDAIRLSNDSTYGLSGSIWTPDIDRAVSVARRLRTGSVGINSKKILDFGAPFGGFRKSGIGRELGPEGIDAYLETSSILYG